MACTCTCAPIIAKNQDRYHALGGETVGCCGNALHTYGFHVPPCRLPKTDYSIVRSGGAGNSSWACAGDFSMNKSWSRTWLAWLLVQVRTGAYPQLIEIIGSLDGEAPMIWQRWNAWKAVKYTGGGHVQWCHLSANRLRASETPDFFAGWDAAGNYSGGAMANQDLAADQITFEIRPWLLEGLLKVRALETSVGELSAKLDELRDLVKGLSAPTVGGSGMTGGSFDSVITFKGAHVD